MATLNRAHVGCIFRKKKDGGGLWGNSLAVSLLVMRCGFYIILFIPDDVSVFSFLIYIFSLLLYMKLFLMRL